VRATAESISLRQLPKIIMTNQDNANINKNSTVTLREVTKENLRTILNLEVAPNQKDFVAPNAVSIAQAYFEREIAWFRAIYADETPVGFLMLSDDASIPEYFLWRLMIDARYQKLGFAKQAMLRLFEYVRTRPGAVEIFCSCVPGEGSPQGFYESLGFTLTGEVDGDEVVMRCEL
jgi:diamine N-acetyltransferase